MCLGGRSAAADPTIGLLLLLLLLLMLRWCMLLWCKLNAGFQSAPLVVGQGPMAVVCIVSRTIAVDVTVIRLHQAPLPRG